LSELNPRRPALESDEVPGAPPFSLLGDQPYAGNEDPLGFDRIADDLCALVLASRSSTPFTLGIEAGWGMGKSSLLTHLRRRLEESGEPVRTVQFNPWAADDGRVLEGLLKTVLGEVDENALRRVLRDKHYLKHVRLVTRAVARIVRLGDVVDLIWEEMSISPRARNDFHEIIEKAMADWCRDDPQRALCVFVDDLDRCSPASVFEVFEAIKLYLDARGLVFVIAYDADVVSESILEEKQYSKAVTSRQYLEKIVQVFYRIPLATTDQMDRLFESYAAASNTKQLLDNTPRSLIIERNARNPRRIKRFINGLVLEYQRDRALTDRDQQTLIRTHLLHNYFPDFARLLGDVDRRDPVTQFNTYMNLRKSLLLGQSPTSEEEGEYLRGYGIDPTMPPANLLSALEEEMPASFPTLAQDKEFRSLLEAIGTDEQLRPVRERLKERLADDWQSDVQDPVARRVLQALLDSKWEFRTAKGIAKESGVPLADVQELLDRYPQFVRRSSLPDRDGAVLFAARAALRSSEGN
jgi:KAP family P-loop domain